MPLSPARRRRTPAGLLGALVLLLATLPALASAGPAAAAPADLVVNGSFEQPALADGTYDTLPGLPGWTVVGDPLIELEHHSPLATAYDGGQNVELDSTGSSTIRQVVPVTRGTSYALSYAFSPRPGYDASQNVLRVSVDGSVLTRTADGTGLTDAAWTLYRQEVTATADTMTLQFSDGGPSDSFGTMLDAVSLVPLYDAAQVAQNTSWTTAQLLPEGSPTPGTLGQPGEARWYRFPVTPGSRVAVSLTGLSADADLTLFGDIGTAFTDVRSPADLARVDTEQTGNVYSPSVYSPSVYSPSVYSPSVYSPDVFAPSVYSPSVYSPSVYSPAVYSPSVYSPSVYSPSVYSPSVYSPSVYSPDAADQTFLDAFSSAQTRSLIGGSSQPGPADESVSAATWSASGQFYVRVQLGQGAATTPFTVQLTTTGGPCSGIALDDGSGTALPPVSVRATTVVLTDTTRLGLTDKTRPAYLATLKQLTDRTGGVVVDAAGVARTVALNRQADASPGCPYAKNLVAQSLRDVVNQYRDVGVTSSVPSALTYVVIAGGDDVVPFFRYADGAGIGPEQDYVPPVRDSSASQGSLRTNTVLGQDAYGARADLTVKGGVLPVPDLAVGRLVESPADIQGAVSRFLASSTLPAPKSSLVTGYDFLTSAADAVQSDLSASLGGGADSLITDDGVAPTTTTVGGTPSRATSWTATDLRAALARRHHDVLLLAGHFSSASTLAADYATQVSTYDLAGTPGLFTGSLVISPGCHAGYSVPDGDAVAGVTPSLDWAQLVAQQGGTLVSGSGYQYADTDFLAYSAELYTRFVAQLRTGAVGSGVELGTALVRAKQAYLADVGTLSGIDQKSLLEATLYGLPMTGIVLPGARTTPAATDTTTPAPVTTGPGAQLGLSTAALPLQPQTTVSTRTATDTTGAATSRRYTWYTGTSGVSTGPALPALPEQVTDVTSTTGAALRGVGLRSGTYTDTPGITPLTGAPATETNGVHTTFDSPSFWPHRLTTVNSYGRLAPSGDGRTRLVVTPAQYRDEPGTPTTTQRLYSGVGLQLFYSGSTASTGGHRPALAAPPSLSDVSGVASGGSIGFSVRATGDPTAGIQGVWVTYTGETGPLHGAYASVDLVQSLTDPSTWTGTLALPAGQAAGDVRFLVQAVNGVGEVALDDDLGDGHVPTVASATPPPAPAATGLVLTTAPTSTTYGSTLPVGVRLTGAPAGSPVTVALGGASAQGTTAADGTATVQLRVGVAVGSYRLTASYAGDATHLPSAATGGTVQVGKAPTALTPSATSGTVSTAGLPARTFTLTSRGVPLLGKAVSLDVVDGSGRLVVHAVRTTDRYGRVQLGAVTLPVGQLGMAASFAVPLSGGAADPSYAASAGATVLTVKK